MPAEPPPKSQPLECDPSKHIEHDLQDLNRNVCLSIKQDIIVSQDFFGLLSIC